MYLKKLEIYGFKSFGEKVEINFDDQVTGIVGPNGSGKSNIVDAIRWVLGEQSVKSLRGGKMEDVIFSGSEEKKPLGYAKVSMTIDNSTGILPIDYEEVEVERRLYRSGESEYYINKKINKKPVRLKDVHELFMDTGLSKSGYSIIGQGKIESIVNNSATDRKLMIEEAVGIVKYKSRKNEALKRLDKVRDNLYRILDIITDREKRLPGLERDSKKAREYASLSERLKELSISLFVYKADEFKVKLDKFNKDEEIMRDTLFTKEQSICSLNEKYDALRKEVNIVDEQMNSSSNEMMELASTFENSKVELEVNKSKIQNLAENIATLEETIVGLTEEGKKWSKEKEEKENILKEKNIVVEKIIKEYEDLEKDTLRLKDLSNETEGAISKENVQISTKEKILKNKENLLVENGNRLKQNLYIIQKIKEENEKLETAIEENEKALDSDENLQNEDRLEKLDSKNNKLLEQRYVIEEAKADFNQALLEKYNNIKLLTGQKEILAGYEENKEGYNFGIKKLFNYSKNTDFQDEMYGTIGDLIKVPEKYTSAIVKALGASISHVVVKNEQTAKKAIKVLKENKWGSLTFLPHNIIKPRNNNFSVNALGFEGIASDLVSCDSLYLDIIKNVLGGVLVFDTYDNANNFARKSNNRYKIATLTGEIFFPGGAISGGRNAKNNNDELLIRKNKIEQLSKKIALAKKDYNETLKNGNDFDEKLKEKDEEISKLQDKINEVTLIINMAEDKNRRQEEDIDNNIKTLKDNKDKIENLNKASEKIKQFNTELEDEIDILSKEIETKKEELSKISLGLYKDKYIEKNNELHNKELDLRAEEEKQRNINLEIGDITEKINDIKDTIIKYTLNIKQNNEEVSKLKYENEQYIKIESDYENAKKSLADSHSELLNRKDKASKNFDKVNKELMDLNEEKHKLNEEIQNIQNKKEKVLIKLEYLQQDILEDYGLTYALAKENEKPIENVLEVETEVKELKIKIKKLGNINTNSIEEYKTIKEEFDFLSEQKDDLQQSKEELLKIIGDMNEKIETRFIMEFDEIQKEFDKAFKQLFEGGTARLVLTDPENIMESGIDIEASPPKAKLKNIASLSGGEKSMTAIALIFAILKRKPAPFCILDEIDAALDDANVTRFCNYLNAIIADNQFVIITHRKITMSIADILYGATMGTSGITKIVSVKLKDIEEGGEIVG